MTNVGDIIAVSSSDIEEISVLIKFLNEFVDFHKKTFSLHLLVYPRRTFLTKRIIEQKSSA